MGIFTILMEVEGMNEIKFRVWEENIKQMFYNVGIVNDELYLMLDGVGFDVVGDYREFKLMQYTGLKDKNGKEIYEGDIVNVNHYDGTPKYETVRFYTIAGFAGIHPFTDSGHHWDSHRCEIVGNIYENPIVGG